ncbi:sigma-70 family RNA polymerase sigma factor [Streptomyces sp. NBC_01716]|uniref:sigma-70 family RNA polymerase sigma factor n=1 Tax=Streptomyces sp. NBC_01716 TaxID=2975917 RepID=UPI002E31B7A3|nr:sigma-70 family RNA polymerase sigma factor [Streptomyces sp. NBC_01716]
MSGDGQDGLPLGGGAGGAGTGGLPSEQVPYQGGPRGSSGAAGPVLPGPPPGEAEPSVPPQREGSARTAEADPLTEGPATDLPPSDAELIQRMRAGDDGAYEELYRRHSAAVLRYARTCCRDGHTADDLTAEVFARTLQAVRGGAGPEQAVRAYLLTTVRRVAAAWTKTAKREQLVEDFAVFAAESARSAEVSDDETLDLGADVRAMHEAERSLAMQAFRSLPERWQAVLWHTTVEEESPSTIAPLFGLTANATAVLASRAREGLKQAYLQAHVNTSVASAGDCARYADRLGAYARGGLRIRAERGLRKHLEECAKCRLVAGELAHVNAGIPAVLPIAVIGWFAAGYSLKAAGVVAGGAVGAAGAGAAAAAGGASGSAGGSAAAGGAAAEGLGAPLKAGIAAVVALAAAAGLVWALSGDEVPDKPEAKPPVVQPVVPEEPTPPPESKPPAAPAPPPPAPPAKKPAPAPTPTPEPKPSPTPTKAKPTPPKPPPPAPTPASPKPPAPSPPPPPPAPEVYQVNQLKFDVLGDGSGPEVRIGQSSWLWQRPGMSIGGTRYGHGASMHAAGSVTIDLNRRCATYQALVGVDDMTLGLGAVRFSVYGDGGRLWRSPVVRGGEAAVPVSVGIGGQKTIRLVVEPHTPLEAVAVADWAQSRISCG